jgi:hypothetical protein
MDATKLCLRPLLFRCRRAVVPLLCGDPALYPHRDQATWQALSEPCIFDVSGMSASTRRSGRGWLAGNPQIGLHCTPDAMRSFINADNERYCTTVPAHPVTRANPMTHPHHH